MSHTANITVSHRDREFTCRMFFESTHWDRGWDCERIDGIRTLAGRVLSDEQVARWLRLVGPDVARDIKYAAVDKADAIGREDW